MSDFSWFWATEFGRDNILREQLLEQAETTHWLARSQREDTERLRRQLGSLEGDMSSRLNALSDAFVAYVELDAVRQQLAGFPANEQVRRHAREDLDALVAGRKPAPRAEATPDYWLAPAVAALSPDGKLDQTAAQRAIELDPQAARTFLLVTRAAFGATEGLSDDLVSVMGPHDEGGQPTWTASQVMLWAATLRGAFGPDALAALRPVVEPALEAEPPTGWQDWVAGQSNGLGSASEERQISWIADQLASAVEPVGATEQDTGWRMTWTPPPGSTGEQPQASVTSTDDPEATRESNRQLLLGIAEILISEGAPGERELLARAAQLRKELSGSTLAPGGAQATADESQAPALGNLTSASVLSQVRQLAIDPNASPHDRRLLWSWIAPHLRGWLTELVNRERPAAEIMPVGGRKQLVATANGVVDDSELERARSQVLADYHVAPSLRFGWQVIIGAALAMVAGIVFLGLTGQAAWWWLIVAGAAGTVAGVMMRSKHREQLTMRDEALGRLTEDVSNALARASRADQAALRVHEETTEAARRALSLLPD